MGSSLYLLRVKSAVADSGIAIAVGLLLMCILSAVIVSTGVITPVSNYSPTVLLSDDATESPSETEHLITQANDVDARVSHSTAAYTSGQQLRNEHAYPLGAVDNVTVIGSSKGEAATVTQQELVLAYQATLPGESSAFWSDTTVLAEQSFEDYSEGEVVRVQDTINISDVEQRQESLQDDFGGDVNVETMVLVWTQYEYTHPGKTTDPGDDTVISKSAEHTNKISFTEQLFVLPNTAEETSSTTGGEQSSQSNGGLLNILLIALTVMSGIGAVYSIVGARRYDSEHVRFELDEARHEEWVTIIDRFKDSSASTTSRVRSLSDLVDLAIDKHDRVVYCCTEHKYYFVDGDVQYEYEPDVYPSYANTFGDVVTPQATTDEEEQADTVESDPETDSTTEPQEEDTDHPSNDDPPET